MTRVLYNYALAIDTAGSIRSLSDTRIGSPKHVVTIEGRYYTLPFLHFFLRYLFAASAIDMESLGFVWELGPGYGGQAEIFLKLHPRVTYIAMDIPPMAYVTERYLQALFPGEVLGYAETREMERIGQTEIGSHRVVILCPWQTPQLDLPVDLFWNAASFQEMEQNVVQNYLDWVDRLAAKRVLLYTSVTGHKPGAGGQVAPITAQSILEMLSPKYALANDPPSDSSRFVPDQWSDDLTGYELLLLNRS